MNLVAVAATLTLLGAEPDKSATLAKGDDSLAVLKAFRSEFVEITPGKGKYAAAFDMGEDRGAVLGALKTPKANKLSIVFKHEFAIGRYEVRNKIWRQIMDVADRAGPPDSPVAAITFHQADEFCTKATKALRDAKLIDAKQVVRLPTEAEWEYCARAGTTTRYCSGDDEAGLKDYAWFRSEVKELPSVGGKKPNAWGLHDMHGSANEWCSDDYAAEFSATPADGRRFGDGKSEDGVIRGGCLHFPANCCRSAFRLGRSRDSDAHMVGLRCVIAAE